MKDCLNNKSAVKNIILSFVFVFWGVFFCCAQESRNVLYGERSEVFKEDNNNVQLFLDKNGDFYPLADIDNIELRSTATIKGYFKNNTASFVEISLKYDLEFQHFSDSNYLLLQEAIINERILSINNKSSEFKDVFILIHGFRKPILPKGNDTSSQQDNISFRNSIPNNDSIFFIEVYWDCMYDCCLSLSAKKNKSIFKLFEEQARMNAVKSGYGLRNVISKISKENITLISHSLGARVAVSTLFNTYDDYIESSKQVLETPSQKKVDICLIAPGISKDPFSEYFERTTNLDYKLIDNYNLSIVYNRKDFVLLKRDPKVRVFGPGPRDFGNTSLGCNHKREAIKLKKYFKTNFKNSKIELINAPIGKNHLFRVYANSNAVQKYLNSIID